MRTDVGTGSRVAVAGHRARWERRKKCSVGIRLRTPTEHSPPRDLQQDIQARKLTRLLAAAWKPYGLG